MSGASQRRGEAAAAAAADEPAGRTSALFIFFDLINTVAMRTGRERLAHVGPRHVATRTTRSRSWRTVARPTRCAWTTSRVLPPQRCRSGRRCSQAERLERTSVAPGGALSVGTGNEISIKPWRPGRQSGISRDGLGARQQNAGNRMRVPHQATPAATPAAAAAAAIRSHQFAGRHHRAADGREHHPAPHGESCEHQRCRIGPRERAQGRSLHGRCDCRFNARTCVRRHYSTHR